MPWEVKAATQYVMGGTPVRFTGQWVAVDEDFGLDQHRDHLEDAWDKYSYDGWNVTYFALRKLREEEH